MKWLATYIAAFALLACLSCGPPKLAGEQTATCRRPYDVSTESNDAGLTVGWKIDCPQLISGYNVYIAPTSIENFGDISTMSKKPHNDAVYPGDTDPDDPVVYYEASGLDNSVLYQVAVRVVFPDRTLSAPSEPVLARCGPRGEFELVSRYSGERDGYSFGLGEHVRVDDLNNDLYFYSKDGRNYVASPSRLDGFLRTNLMMHQSGRWNIEEYILRGNRHGEKPTEDRVEIRKGDLIWMTTSEGDQAQLRVLSIEVADGKGAVRLGFSYWPKLDVPTP
jgi:hypothetical protein